MGGCGVPNCSRAPQELGGQFHWDDVTLGQIQDACIVSGRGLARFAIEHLNKPELVVIERHGKD